MYIFKDYYRNEVHLSFEKNPFSSSPKHVWVICQYKNQWLLTEHKDRGLEFPGGKVEKGETAAEAAIREVKEETGGVVETLHYLGQYYVNGKNGDVVKNVYHAKVDTLYKQDTYYETNGPVLLDEIPVNIKQLGQYSFIMKDEVLTHCMRKINL